MTLAITEVDELGDALEDLRVELLSKEQSFFSSSQTQGQARTFRRVLENNVQPAHNRLRDRLLRGEDTSNAILHNANTALSEGLKVQSELGIAGAVENLRELLTDMAHSTADIAIGVGTTAKKAAGGAGLGAGIALVAVGFLYLFGGGRRGRD